MDTPSKTGLCSRFGRETKVSSGQWNWKRCAKRIPYRTSMNVCRTSLDYGCWSPGDSLLTLVPELNRVGGILPLIPVKTRSSSFHSYGADWVKFYETDPLRHAAEVDERLILGGEVLLDCRAPLSDFHLNSKTQACLWGEFVNSVNLIPRLWPRASAVAERLWSDKTRSRRTQEAARRLQEMECRLLR